MTGSNSAIDSQVALTLYEIEVFPTVKIYNVVCVMIQCSPMKIGGRGFSET